MANIKLNLAGVPFTGQSVTFTAPCGCDQVTDGLAINGVIYTVVDAMGNCVTGKGGAWCSGAQVSVVLDCENRKAYIKNAGAVSHASHHATDGVDPLTPNDIGALKLYTSLEEIGITKGSETIASIIAGMANYSVLMLNVNTDNDGYNADTYPSSWGFLTVKKYTLYRVEIDFMDVKSSPTKFYKKSYREALGNVYESDWTELATTDYAVNKAGDTMLGDLTVTAPSARGSISVIDGRYERKAQIEQNTDVARLNNLQDSANYSSVVLRPETEPLAERLQLIEKINGSQNKYNVLHTGNVTSGTTDITAGTTALATGAQYHVYE